MIRSLASSFQLAPEKLLKRVLLMRTLEVGVLFGSGAHVRLLGETQSSQRLAIVKFALLRDLASRCGGGSR